MLEVLAVLVMRYLLTLDIFWIACTVLAVLAVMLAVFVMLAVLADVFWSAGCSACSACNEIFIDFRCFLEYLHCACSVCCSVSSACSACNGIFIDFTHERMNFIEY